MSKKNLGKNFGKEEIILLLFHFEKQCVNSFKFVSGRPIPETNSESGFLIGRSARNSWRKLEKDRSSDKPDTLQRF